MRTVRCSDHRRGVYLPREVYLSRGSVPAGGVPAQEGCTRQEGGTSPAGVCIPACTEADTPPPPVNRMTDRHYGMSTLYTRILSNQKPCCVGAASQWVHKKPYQLSCVIISVDRAVTQELMFQRNLLEYPSQKIILKGCYIFFY